jgi:hypothetical protein
MPAHQAEQLADFLRRCTKLRIALEAVGPPAAPDASTSRASVGGQHADAADALSDASDSLRTVA